ncbi:hypothetical protein ATPR_1520 [Acetobacter tropicalis NBRC 101654]|uniref:Uncharacterized protein n=1 Tax=Acetobacter tropicalis NBRC 101654 TaxID=749388 RepID=F7VDS1_9PROT|nr:hypothetical protein ATPR_1520 [Acetobacter tropicalis NBRC 101654]
MQYPLQRAGFSPDFGKGEQTVMLCCFLTLFLCALITRLSHWCAIRAPVAC